MSTEFYTIPGIEYSVFLAATSVDVSLPRRNVYIMPHMVLGFEGSRIMCFEQEDGTAWFERFGGNDPYPVFMNILDQFSVKIFDQYGLEWPLESGG